VTDDDDGGGGGGSDDDDNDDDDDDSLLRAVQFSVEPYAKRLAAPSAITSLAARKLLKHYRNFPVRVARSGKQNYDNFDLKKNYSFSKKFEVKCRL
jgi:hypothetical protein